MKMNLFKTSMKLHRNSVVNANFLNDRVRRFIRSTAFNSRFISLIVKISANNDSFWRSIDRRVILDLENKHDITNYINRLIRYTNGHIEDWYNGLNPEYLHFEWIDASDTDYIVYQNNVKISKLYKKLDINISRPYKFPFDIEYSNWGTSVTESSNEITVKNITFDDNIELITIKNSDIKNKKIVVLYQDGDIKSFTDTKLSFGNYLRIFSGTGEQYLFNNVTSNPLFYFEKMYSNDVMFPSKKTDRNINIATLDIETYIHNNEHKILCICFYDGEETYKFYISDFDSSGHLLTALFNKIMQPKYNNYNIYIHNGSSFDLIFLLKHLTIIKNVDIIPTYKDGKFLNLKLVFTIKNVKYNVNIKDSLLLLPSSLASLAKSFGFEDKGLFPYMFPNKSNFNYVGKVPSYRYFDHKKVNLSQYNEYKSSFMGKVWVLRLETMKYCELDCILLYNIIKEFNNLIYNKFNINIASSVSLPSLAFKIYKAIFMPTELKDNPKFRKNNSNLNENSNISDKIEVGIINNLDPNLYNELKESYFGGHTDMYIPAGPIARGNVDAKPEDKAIVPHNNKNIYEYDVNSLYPSVMANNKFPNKLFGKFIGDIRYFDRFKYMWDDMLSICKVRVTAPYGIKNPILPFRDDKTGRVIYPDGNWEGMYCSVEIKNAEKYGYKFEILSGYLFTSSDLFSTYVQTMYKIKEESTKGSAMYTISKLLLNSLYGRFGLNPILDKFMITTKKDMENKLKTDLPYLEERIDFDKLSMCSFHSKNNASSNVAIASFVTAYARIHMSHFFNVKGFSIFYTDTDSIFTDQPLPESIVDSKKMGYMKLEAVFCNFITIGPKNWIGIDTSDNITCKMKGSKNKLSYLDLLLLMQYESDLVINQNKWYKSFKESNIIIKNTPFTIKTNNNKRVLVFNNNVLCNTKNITVLNKEIIR